MSFLSIVSSLIMSCLIVYSISMSVHFPLILLAYYNLITNYVPFILFNSLFNSLIISNRQRRELRRSLRSFLSIAGSQLRMGL